MGSDPLLPEASALCSFDFSQSLSRDLSPPLQAQSSRKEPPSAKESLQVAGGVENFPWSSELWRRVLGPAGTACSTDETTDSPWHLGEGDMSLSHPEWHLSVLIHSWPRGLCLLVQHSCAGTGGQPSNCPPGWRGMPTGLEKRDPPSSATPVASSGSFSVELRPLGNDSSP